MVVVVGVTTAVTESVRHCVNDADKTVTFWEDDGIGDGEEGDVIATEEGGLAAAATTIGAAGTDSEGIFD